MEQGSKNADISIFSNFLAIFGFSQYREILPNTVNISSFKSIGPSKQKLQRKAESDRMTGNALGHYQIYPLGR